MNEEWKQILADYNKAKHDLWSPQKGSSRWFRDEETVERGDDGYDDKSERVYLAI